MMFGAPQMSVLLWLLPAVAVFFILSSGRRKSTLERFAEKGLLAEIAASYDNSRRKRKDIIKLAALFFIAMALMRPQWGFEWKEVKKQGIDIIIALDTSKSMLAEDVRPNRLERAKLAVKDMVKKLKGDRLGLIAFSGSAFLQCPLTIDYDGFLLALDDISVDTIPMGGTSISEAIYKAIESYEKEKKENKILIIITDGEDLEGGVDKAVQKAKVAGINIYCVGIGSEEGELVPVRDAGTGKTSFLKDMEGNVVKTRLREDVLQSIALQTGGMYVRATGAEFGLDLIYEKKLAGLEKEEFKSRMEKRYYERFQLPLFIAGFLLLIEVFLGDRRKNIVN
ncbi:MAG: VWA domain-containing protein [Candidatus Omnitrophica bacterium]|nr:VWA domain-containing protein [Candidatus Omnitrophota bacterium]MDD5487519.1 VWA domain-containing protein [Candidatus Omnitrophota bacterium]